MQKLFEADVGIAEYIERKWVVQPRPGTPFEDLLKPECWSHVSGSASAGFNRKICQGDIIVIRPLDMSYRAELIVLDAGPHWGAHVQVLQHYKLGIVKTAAVSEAASDDFYVEHTTGTKWRVRRKSDKQEMVRDLMTKEDAESWVRKHQRPTAAAA